MKIRLGTRGSKLALWQAEFVKRRIEKQLGWEVEIVKIKTKGDKITDVPLAKIGGKGLFVKEIEEALLRNEIDIAVHSLKDMPAQLPEGLEIIAFTEREEPWDVLISNQPVEKLSPDLSVGTSSLRRKTQLLKKCPGIKVLPLRGNLDTRIRKLKEGQFDAIIVALAGLKRLKVEVPHFKVLKDFIPAIGQGILAVEAKKESFPELTEILNNEKSEKEARAERAFLREMGGSCQIPVGAIATIQGDKIHLKAFIAHPEGEPFYEGEIRASLSEAEEAGRELAHRILSSGAEKILKDLGLR